MREANVPPIFVNACETQAKNLAARLYDYTLLEVVLCNLQFENI